VNLSQYHQYTATRFGQLENGITNYNVSLKRNIDRCTLVYKRRKIGPSFDPERSSFECLPVGCFWWCGYWPTFDLFWWVWWWC